MSGEKMDWRWLKPNEAAPELDLTFSLQKFEQQRHAAAKAAQQMYACSSFYDDPSGESEEGESSDDLDVCDGVPQKLRYAVLSFNTKCDEDETRFQWFDNTIEGPLEVLPVRAEHTKACDLCGCRPSYGEVYFRYNMEGPRSYDKLCERCGMGVLHAAVLAATQDSGEEEEEEEEEKLEENGEEEAAMPTRCRTFKSDQPSTQRPAAARGALSKQAAAAAAAAAASGSLAARKRDRSNPSDRAPAKQHQPKRRKDSKG